MLSRVGLGVSVKQSNLHRINSPKWLDPKESTWAGQKWEGHGTLCMIDNANQRAHTHLRCKYNDGPFITNQPLLIRARSRACILSGVTG